MCYGDLYYIANLPKQINMGFSIIGLAPEEVKLFQGTGKTMRHLKFENINSIDKEELIKIIKLVRNKASPVHPKNKKLNNILWDNKLKCYFVKHSVWRICYHCHKIGA